MTVRLWEDVENDSLGCSNGPFPTSLQYDGWDKTP